MRKKWKLVAKISTAIILGGVVIGTCFWLWNLYESRPRPMYELGLLRLGMTPVEVTLAVGKPGVEISPSDKESVRKYVYKSSYGSGEYEYYVKFSNSSNGLGEYVVMICTESYLHKALGIGVYSTEKDIKNILGEPSHISIRKDGLAKIISYKEWNVAYTIEKSNVESTCVSGEGKVEYVDEYTG